MVKSKFPIAILGATGAVGQRMIQLLVDHPWFEIAALTGSDRTVGRPYGELVRWVLDDAPPPDVARMIVRPSDEVVDVARNVVECVLCSIGQRCPGVQGFHSDLKIQR